LCVSGGEGGVRREAARRYPYISIGLGHVAKVMAAGGGGWGGDGATGCVRWV